MPEGSAMYLQNRIFSPNVIQNIFDSLQPINPDALKIQQAFFPWTAYTSDKALSYFRNNYWGMTPATSLGADPMQIGIPGGYYKGFSAGRWGEQSIFTNKDLEEIQDPEQPFERDGVTPRLWGEDMVRSALAHQKYRMNTLLEAFSAALVSKGTFHYFADGVDKYWPGPTSTDLILPQHYRLDVESSPPWDTGKKWDDDANAKPIFDLNQMILYLATKLGVQVTEIYMSSLAAHYLLEADETTGWIDKNPELSREMLKVQSVATSMSRIVGSKNVAFTIDDRTYPEQMILTSPTVASTSTTVTVDNDAVFEGVTTPDVIFKRADGKERLVKLSNVSNNTLTFTAADLDIAMNKGDIVIYNKRFMAENTVVFKTDKTQLQAFATLPLRVSPDDPRTPGVHTYSDEIVKKPNWYVVVGAMAHMGPIVWNPGGWATLKVFA